MTTKRLAAIVIACCATIFAASAQQQMLTILMHVKEGFGNTYLDKGLTMTETDAATGDTIMIPGADGKPVPAQVGPKEEQTRLPQVREIQFKLQSV